MIGQVMEVLAAVEAIRALPAAQGVHRGAVQGAVQIEAKVEVDADRRRIEQAAEMDQQGFGRGEGRQRRPQTVGMEFLKAQFVAPVRQIGRQIVAQGAPLLSLHGRQESAPQGEPEVGQASMGRGIGIKAFVEVHGRSSGVE